MVQQRARLEPERRPCSIRRIGNHRLLVELLREEIVAVVAEERPVPERGCHHQSPTGLRRVAEVVEQEARQLLPSEEAWVLLQRVSPLPTDSKHAWRDPEWQLGCGLRVGQIQHCMHVENQ